MKHSLTCIAAFFFLLTVGKSTAQTKNNAELQKMYDEDQAGRKVKNIDWSVLSKQDSARRARVGELIREGKLVTGKDFYNSAMIYQHGNDTIASAMAVKQMRKAIELDSTVNKWLLAAAIDRDLMRRNQPQIYGTQFIKMGKDAKWERYKMDTTQVTDRERKYYRVETLEEQRIKEHNMNLLSISEYYSQSGSIDQAIRFLKTEFGKGKTSQYDLSEQAINNFGYQLLGSGKNEDALKVFRLNTELYPKGFNTFDSYGECLLKLGKKKEALKAYKKSLNLNPENENARKVLENNK